jgi:regulatory protein
MSAEPDAESSVAAVDAAHSVGPAGRRASTASTASAAPRGTKDSEADPVAAAREIALRRLSVRARSRKELAQDLKTRDVPAGAAAEVLDRFAEVGLIDDAAFAEEWVESRGRRSGAARLRQELRLKGVAEEHIAEAIAGRDDADLTNARELATRKAGSMKGLDTVVRQRRMTAFLGRRGFSSAVIRRVIGEVLDAEVSGEDN